MKADSHLHIALVSVNFDKSPEGICTGRLVRALLDQGIKITLLTSSKAITNFTHTNLQVYVYHVTPREPRFLFRAIAKLSGHMPDNFYLWTRRIAKHNFAGDKPDIIYGRAWPFASLIGAYELSKINHIPLIAHLSDPIPPPNENHKGHKLLPALKKILEHAKRVTFTNLETIRYQQRYIPLPTHKASVLNHVAGPQSKLPKYTGNAPHYGYLGALGNRKPALETFLRGFKLHLKKYPNAQLDLISIKDGEVKPLLLRLDLLRNVNILPFANNLTEALTPYSALVSFEPQVKEPIWTLTKTIDYLQTNRPIFALTSLGSPTQRILNNFIETCAVTTNYVPEAIAKGFNSVAKINASQRAYDKRWVEMQAYSGKTVATELIDICHQITSAINSDDLLKQQ